MDAFSQLLERCCNGGLAPVFQHSNIAMFAADCRQVLPLLPDNSVQLVLTDPPYEQEAHTLQRRVMRGKNRLVNVPLPFGRITEELRDCVAEQIARVLSQGWAITFCQIEAAMIWRAAYEKYGMQYKRTCIWRAADKMPQYSGDRPGMGYETLITMWKGRGKSRWNGGGKHGVYPSEKHIYDYLKGAELDAERDFDQRHPTEKPLALMKELVLDFSNVGDVILDPFMGSGSTLVAALHLGRRAIGIDLEKRWTDVAAKRLLQNPLFV